MSIHNTVESKTISKIYEMLITESSAIRDLAQDVRSQNAFIQTQAAAIASLTAEVETFEAKPGWYRARQRQR